MGLSAGRVAITLPGSESEKERELPFNCIAVTLVGSSTLRVTVPPPEIPATGVMLKTFTGSTCWVVLRFFTSKALPEKGRLSRPIRRVKIRGLINKQDKPSVIAVGINGCKTNSVKSSA